MSDQPNWLEKTPVVIQHPLISETPNQPLHIFEGVISLQQHDISSNCKGRLHLNWLPTPRLAFELDEVPIGLQLAELNLTIPPYQTIANGFTTSITFNNGEQKCKGIINPPIRTVRESNCDSVIFYLANFNQFIGEHIRDKKGSRSWNGRLNLTDGTWDICIDAAPETGKLIKQLKQQGGYAITHVGRLRKRDSQLFTYQEGTDVLTALMYFLSFCRGAWCSVVCAIGYQNLENMWEEWSIQRITSWKSTETWFPHQSPEALNDITEAFSGFITKWASLTWNDPLRIIIHWFLETNTGAGGVEGGILLTQTALELLGWVHLVEDPTTSQISANKFDKLAAADKIKMLLNSLSVPNIVPDKLTELTGMTDDTGQIDGVDVLVRLRNGVVHPKQSKRDFVLQTSRMSRIEARQLGQWYLELCLLSLMGYKGSYYQRYETGYYSESLTKVPWA